MCGIIRRQRRCSPRPTPGARRYAKSLVNRARRSDERRAIETFLCGYAEDVVVAPRHATGWLT